MATEYLLPNGDDSGWTTNGAGTACNNGINSGTPNDTTYIETTANEGDVINIDLASVVSVDDAATVTSVTIRFRAESTQNGNPADGIACDLIVGGTAQGTQYTTTLTSAFATYTADGATQSWTTDYTAAQLNGAQVRLTSTQSGMPGACDIRVSEVEVDITYTPGATVNEKTLQDLDSCTLTDNAPLMLRERNRETSDTELSNLVNDDKTATKVGIVINNVTLTDTLVVHGDALVFPNVFSTAQRFRDRQTSDTELSNLLIDADDSFREARQVIVDGGGNPVTNLIKWSQEIDDVAHSEWADIQLDVDANATTAPDGTTTAERLKDDNLGGTGVVRIEQANIAYETSTQYTFSAYLKKDQLDWGYLNWFDAGGSHRCYFDLTNGVLGSASAATGAITDVGNGWYLCEVRFTSHTSGTTGTVQINVTDANNVLVIDRDGTSSIFAWQAQLTKTSAWAGVDILSEGTQGTGTAPISVTDSIDATYVPDEAGVNNRVLQDLNSCAVNDSTSMLRLRDREQSDNAVTTDTTAKLRERDRSQSDSITVEDVNAQWIESNEQQVETIDTADDSVELRQRQRVLPDSITVTDDKVAIKTGVQTKVLQDLDSVTVTDAAIELRLRDRSQSDFVDANDAESLFRERVKTPSDAITVDDVNSQWIENNQALVETIDSADDSIEERKRNRTLADSITVLDDKTATYVPPGSVTYDRTLQDLDSCAVTDDAIELRLRDRESLDSAVVTDDKTATYVPADAVINNVTLQDLDSVAVGDSLVALRERIRQDISTLETTDAASVSALRQRLNVDSLEVSDATLRDMVFSLLDALDLSESSAELRQRYRALLDSIDITDSVIVTTDQAITTRTLSDTISLTDSLSATYVQIPPEFNIKIDVQEFNAEVGIRSNIHVVHDLKEETSA